MLRKLFLLSFLACAFVMLGCNKSEMNNNNSAAANTNKAATSSNTSTSTTSSTTTSSSDKIGVPECDDYIAKYEACISGKVPEMARAQYKDSLDKLRSSWRQAASTPQGKAALAAGCKQATEAARASMKSFGCEF